MNKDFTKTLRELIVFASPIAFGQLSQMFIGLGDVFIAAHHGRQTVAAMGIANGVSSLIFLVGLGLLLGISPTIAKKRGESTPTDQYFYTCVMYAVAIGVVFTSLTIGSVYLISYMGFDPPLVPLIKDYLFYVSFSYLGAYIFIAIKEFLQASEHVVVANSISVAAVFVNLFLGYVLAFGIFIFPELGVKGLAYAAIIVRSLMGLSLFIYARRYNKTTFSVIRNFAQHVFKFSIPISMSMFVEFSAFSAMMMLIGRIGALYAAVHSISLTIASTTYMVPLAISSAVSVKVAYFYGRRNFDRMKNFMKAGILLSITFMMFAATCFCLFPKTILGAFTSDVEIISAGIPILFVCALFQILDGAQVTLTGILRGLGITKPTFIIVLAGFWLIGLPLGYYLGYTMKLNAFGFWIGIAVALFIIAASLSVYLLNVLRKDKVIS